jgi:hypothetical protein
MVSSLRDCTFFAAHGCVATPCNGIAPQRVARGPCEAGIGQQRECPTTRMIVGRPHPTSGSHLPPEGTAQPFVVAFRVVASCPAPQKLHTPPRPTAGFRLNKNHDVTRPRVTEDKFAGGCHGRHICDHRQQELSEAAQLLSLSLLRWGRNCFSEP